MYRANHGQWNTVWGNKDNGPRSARYLDLRGLVPEEDQRQMARVYLERVSRGDPQGTSGSTCPLFRDHRVIGAWLPKTMYMTRFQESGFQALADLRRGRRRHHRLGARA